MQTIAQGIVKMVTHHHHIRSFVRCNKSRKINKNENLTLKTLAYRRIIASGKRCFSQVAAPDQEADILHQRLR